MPLMNNPRQVQYIVGVFVLLALLAYSTRCRAEDVYFSVGSPVLRGQAPAVDLSWRFASPLTDAFFQTSLTLVGSSTYKDESQSNQAALQALYVDGLGPVDIGVGVALLQNADRYNGSTANFALQVGWNFRVFGVDSYIQWRHWSNAGTQSPNLGRDIVFFGARFGGRK